MINKILCFFGFHKFILSGGYYQKFPFDRVRGIDNVNELYGRTYCNLYCDKCGKSKQQIFYGKFTPEGFEYNDNTLENKNDKPIITQLKEGNDNIVVLKLKNGKYSCILKEKEEQILKENPGSKIIDIETIEDDSIKLFVKNIVESKNLDFWK